MIKAWIFDLGKTLMEIPDEFDEEFCIQQILGHPNMELIRSHIYRLCDRHPGLAPLEFIRRLNVVLNPSRQGELDIAMAQAWRTSVEKAILKPGAWEILDCLRAAGKSLALVSNTPPTSIDILRRLDLERRFDCVVFSCDHGYLKPDPRLFQVALDGLGVSPDEVVLVGDKVRTDILGGAILGMHCILVETRLRCVVESDQNFVDVIVPRLSDIMNTKLYRESCGRATS